MGTLKNGAAAGIWKGKVGNMVFSSWNTIYTIRLIPTRKSSTKQSAKQNVQNAIFRMVMQFFSEEIRIIKIGFQRPRKAKMTALNMATSYHMLNAMVGDSLQPCIDLAKIKFSKPIKSTQCAWNAALFAEEGRIIKITWELNPFPLKCTQLNDRAIFIIFDKDLGGFPASLQGDAQRDALIYTAISPIQCLGNELFVYMFLVSADGKLVSETEYLGSVTVIP